MRRPQRLKRRRDFATVFREGRRYRSDMLVIRVRQRPPDAASTGARFGFAVGRRVGSAVVRNRIKRRLREIVRRTPVRDDVDVVVIALPRAAAASFAALQSTLDALLRRASVLADDDAEVQP